MYKKIILLMLIVVINASGNDYEYYFYNPDIDYGSESIFNPISLFINGSFDILRNGLTIKIFLTSHLKPVLIMLLIMFCIL